ncbi:MAG: hypothetical protein COA92_03675 [Sulfurovum sp.]|nr:MAG: hypothetical protein COA92_03675 [Sulfurovum sp.]
MKKTLLLSVVASTMIMAGGDIAPVEPVVEAPVVASGWDFNGEAVGYYQTMDNFGNGSLFEQNANIGGVQGQLPGFNGGKVALEGISAANVGLRLGATNNDLFAGVGAGVELVGLGTLGLHGNTVDSVMQTGDGSLNSGALTQAYLTYGFGNTSLKVGRQTLPKGLSPFAFSETWNVFQNTFGAALVVNTDLPDTALVYVYVANANSHANLSDFNDLNPNGDGVHLITAQNKSFDGLTLTGSWYYAPDMLVTEDVNILWGDAAFAVSDYSIGVQGGTILTGEPVGVTDTTAFGAKIGADFGMFNVGAAYTTVDEGTVGVRNLATAANGFAETVLYTQMLANVNWIDRDNDTFVVKAGVDALGGNFGVAYGATTDNAVGGTDYTEIDVAYTAQVTDNVSVLAAYIYQDVDVAGVDANNALRFWARYNF